MKLIEPSITLKSQYLEMIADWEMTQEKLVPYKISYDYSNFNQLVERLLKEKTEVVEGMVCNSTFWLTLEDNTIVGVSNLRHELNDQLYIDGGHIGYGIRPSYRKNGYATKILELTLLEAQKLKIDKALITCDKENLGSAKTIIKNGGVLWKEEMQEKMKQYYWIDIGHS